MSKYIDADRLKAEIERLYDIARDASYNGEIEGEMTAYDKILSLITSLQQEQPEGNLEYWLEHFGMPKENIDYCITQIAQGYGACRYLEGIQHGAEAVNELAQQEQPEVKLDLEKELKNERTKLLDAFGSMNGEQCLALRNFARHFYELGLNAKKEE